jgi:glycosyltransferase involved in cell wall biosynthesis
MAHKSTSCLLIGGPPSMLVNFRGPLIRAMRAKGLTVFAAANGQDADTESRLASWGVEYCPIRIARSGMNPLVDIVTLFDLFRLMRRIKPDIVLAYTIKPVVYGGLAARWAGVPSIYSLVPGLGYAFMDTASTRQKLAGQIARSLYRMSLRHSRRVFFQNPDDADTFVATGLVVPERAVVVNGSGVDLEHFPFVEMNHASVFGGATRPHGGTDRPVRFLLIARLLWDKGIGEYVAAARNVKRKYPSTEFHLIGPFDSNPSRLTARDVTAWQDEGLIRFHGPQADVRPFLRDCHVFVLPSFYREGTPRTVLEAMATGRAVITTDAPGCRETVLRTDGGHMDARRSEFQKLQMGSNGILVPVKDPDALAAAMEFFIENPQQMAVMGRAGRHYAQQRYDVRAVNETMLREMEMTGCHASEPHFIRRNDRRADRRENALES